MLQSDVIVFITASSDVPKLERAINSAKLSFENVRVNLNSLDTQFIEDAQAKCTELGIQHDVTESNGFPAKGKNATFDLFKATNFEYLFMCDGDDYLADNTFDVTNEVVGVEDSHAILFQGGEFQFSDLDQRILPVDRMEHVHNNSYPMNKRLWGKLYHSDLNIGHGYRITLYRRGVVTSDMARMDESIKGMEDMNHILKLVHYRNTEQIRLTRLRAPKYYIYDLGSGFGDYLGALYRKPEEYSQNMVNFWKGLEGLNIRMRKWESEISYWRENP